VSSAVRPGATQDNARLAHRRRDHAAGARPARGGLHRATMHQPSNERWTSSQRLGMATGRATLTNSNGWRGGGGRRRSRGGAWLGPAQQWLHQEHAISHGALARRRGRVVTNGGADGPRATHGLGAPLRQLRHVLCVACHRAAHPRAQRRLSGRCAGNGGDNSTAQGRQDGPRHHAQARRLCSSGDRR
jgi:hypothetical protein